MPGLAIGDTLTFGLTRRVREELGVDDVVDKCSGWYTGGGVAGDLMQDYLLGAGLARLGKAGRYIRCRNSFVAGTLVQTPEGPVAIETLKVGDQVLARSETTGQVGPRPITEVIVSADKLASDLTLDINDRTETLGVTSEHPFWVKGQGWTKAHLLAPGALVYTRDGSWARVVGTVPRPGVEYVYNLEVGGYHTFFVGEVGVWVHNCVPRLTARMKSGAQEIARAGRIDKVEILVEKFGGKAGGWRKMKTWDEAGREIHYYEHHGIGVVGKKWLGDHDPF